MPACERDHARSRLDVLRRLAVGLLLSAGSLAVTALAAESTLRLWNPLDLDWRMVRPDRERELALGRGFDGSFKGVRVRTNGFGHRVPTAWDKRYEAQKPAGARRILVFGDSFTFGDEWPAEATFVERLQQRLDPDFAAVQVLNLGVFGYGPEQEWRYLREEALRFQPDAVIVQFADANDLMPDTSVAPMTWLRRHAYLHWVLADLWYHGRASFVGRALWPRAHADPAPRRADGWLRPARRAAEAYYRSRLAAIRHDAAGWRQARACYARMAAYLAERGVPLIIVVTVPNWDLACGAWACRGADVTYQELIEPGREFYDALNRALGSLTPHYVPLDRVFGPHTVEQLYDSMTWHYGPKKAGLIAEHLAAMLPDVWADRRE